MNRCLLSSPLLALLLSACASAPPEQPRIAELEDRPLVLPPAGTTAIDADAALETYRLFLKDAPDGPAYREALRRSADVELEDAERLKPVTAETAPDQTSAHRAIKLYLEFLAKYPADPNGERVLYQLAKAYDLNGEMENSLLTLERLLRQYPNSRYAEEALFRSGEMHFSMRDHAAAERAFKAIIRKYPDSIYFERALYMSGWSSYLQNRFEDALQTFFTLLDRKLNEDSLAGDALSDKISPADRELLDDSLKVICLALSYQGIRDPIDGNFDRHGDRPYEALIYRRLGDFYLGKQRYLDAAHTFMGMTRRHPDHPLAPEFHQYAVKAYEDGGFLDLFFAAKAAFIKNYGVASNYWQSHDENIRRKIRPYLANDIKDLAAHFHSIARRTKTTEDFHTAVRWYREYLKTFTSGDDAAEMNFMLAECLDDAGRYKEAIAEYEKSAYEYDVHKNSAESGYAALLAYKEAASKIPGNEREQWHYKAIASAIRFSEHFPEDSRVARVLANAIDELYAMHDYARTIDTAQRLLARPTRGSDELRRNAWIVLGHARFETQDYVDAQQAYQTALDLLPGNDPQRAGIIGNLAASMYKQGEQRRAAGDLKGAIALFMQIEKAAPAPTIWIAAKYDAAATLIELEDWTAAASVLEDFHRRKLGDPQLQRGVTEKLALVYMKTGQKWKAAREMEALSASTADNAKHRELIWEAAALYQETEAYNDAVRLYKQFVDEYPDSFADGIEARHRLSVLYTQLDKPDEARFWLNEIIKADKDAGPARTDRSRQLAGEATLSIARPLVQAYQEARLTLPLKKSLKIKKALMEKAIAVYKKALGYQVADVSTAATYQLGNIYDHFSKAISSSERPRGLSKDELEQYNILLEDQSDLFQDKAIQLYEANLKHIADGIYDEWIKDSLKALAVLYPVRYAKTEESEAFFDAVP
jgi:tetratricopeptide (TPR) repeat protein